MKAAATLREFSNHEKQFVTAYIMAYAWDVTRKFKMVEQKVAANLVLHYALPATHSPLSTKQLASLGPHALALRDDFKRQLTELNIPITKAAVAIQFLGAAAMLGIVNREDPMLFSKAPEESMELEVYLPDSEPTAPTD